MNSVQLIGRLGQEPEIKETTNGKLLAKFSLGVYRNKENTDWVNCEAWEKTAELVRDHVLKGHQVGVAGRLQESKWEDDEGKKRTKHTVVVNNISLLTNKDKEKSATSSTSTIVEGEDDEDLPF